MKKQLIFILAIVMIISLFAGCGNNPDNNEGTEEGNESEVEAVVIKIAHAAKPDSARDLGAQKVKEIIEKESQGKYKVEIYPASQLGGGPDLIEGMQTGTIEMVILPSAFLGGFQPLTTIMDIPFLLPTEYEKVIKLEQGPAGDKLKETTESIGVKILDIWHTGYKGFTAQTDLVTPEDFKGLKFRVMPSPIQIAQYEALGATPINMDFSETYNALQTGAIDGQENPVDTTYDMKFHEVQKTFTISNHGVLDQFYMAGKEWFEKLPQEDQEIIITALEEGRKVALDKTLEYQEVGLEAFKEEGLTINTLTEEQRSAFEEATSEVKELYVSRYGDEAKELLQIFEEEIDKLQ